MKSLGTDINPMSWYFLEKQRSETITCENGYVTRDAKIGALFLQARMTDGNPQN